MCAYSHPTGPIFQPPTLTFFIGVYGHMSKKFLLSAKPEIVVPGSGILFLYFIFEIFSKPSFVEAVL
jgi:hypothetical protein